MVLKSDNNFLAVSLWSISELKQQETFEVLFWLYKLKTQVCPIHIWEELEVRSILLDFTKMEH